MMLFIRLFAFMASSASAWAELAHDADDMASMEGCTLAAHASWSMLADIPDHGQWHHLADTEIFENGDDGDYDGDDHGKTASGRGEPLAASAVNGAAQADAASGSACSELQALARAAHAVPLEPSRPEA